MSTTEEFSKKACAFCVKKKKCSSWSNKRVKTLVNLFIDTVRKTWFKKVPVIKYKLYIQGIWEQKATVYIHRTEIL